MSRASALRIVRDDHICFDIPETTGETCCQIRRDWHGGCARHNRRPHRPPVNHAPDWMTRPNGFFDSYGRDRNGNELPASKEDKERLNQILGVYAQRRLIRQNPQFGPDVFRQAFHIGTAKNLPAVSTVASRMAEARGAHFDAETLLIIDVLHGMTTGELPPPLAWRADKAIKWLFNLIREFPVFSILDGPRRAGIISEHDFDWVRMVHHDFCIEHIDWLSRKQPKRVADEKPKQRRSDRNERPEPTGQSLGEYLRKRASDEHPALGATGDTPARLRKGMAANQRPGDRSMPTTSPSD